MSPQLPASLSDLCLDVLMLIADHLQQNRNKSENPIKQLSLTNRRLREMLSPLLFKNIHVNQPVSELIPTSLPQRYGRSCQIDMFGSKWWWCSGSYVSSKDALDLFNCIRDLENVTTLSIAMMSRSIDIFQEAFAEQTASGAEVFMFPQIEKLVVSNTAAFLTSHCPNIKSLVIEDEHDYLVEAYANFMDRIRPLCQTGDASKHSWPLLTSCDITAAWSIDEVVALTTTFPQLRSVRLRSTWHCYRAATKDIIQILGETLKDLRTLHLVKCSWLSMGVQSVWKRRIQSCSNAEYRRMLWLENERLRVQVENDVARCAFENIASLQDIWLGERRVAMRARRDSGMDPLQWTWKRKREDETDCSMGDGMFSQWRMEKDAAVVASEIGF